MKYIIVTGGVISGLGKGVTSSSIGALLKGHGLFVTAVKIDPYLNVDAGTFSPLEHGECYVLNDGSECDLDLGGYERFLDLDLTRDNNITTGSVYQRVIEKERRGDYLGKTVQIVPHLTNEIQEMIERGAKVPVFDDPEKVADVCIIELGGTIGDLESAPFVEALRIMQSRVGVENMCFVHVSLVPVISSGEFKTKPTQHSVKELRRSGIVPDFLCVRCPTLLEESIVKKLSLFCSISVNNVISNIDVPNIYFVPELFRSQNFEMKVMARLGLNTISIDNQPQMSELIQHFENQDLPVIRIGIVGKYTGLKDSYLSVIRALEHASFSVGVKVEIVWIDSSTLEGKSKIQNSRILQEVHGVLVPGGYGVRGIEGMINAANYCFDNSAPYLGLCLGMQVLVISHARRIGIENANSEEFDPEGKMNVISFMPDSSLTQLGGTMRLGVHRTVLGEGSRFGEVGKVLSERHRHRYEVNPNYINRLEGSVAGSDRKLTFTGKDTTGKRMEIVECGNLVGCQFHPELRSRHNRPSELFVHFLKSCCKKS